MTDRNMTDIVNIKADKVLNKFTLELNLPIDRVEIQERFREGQLPVKRITALLEERDVRDLKSLVDCVNLRLLKGA